MYQPFEYFEHLLKKDRSSDLIIAFINDYLEHEGAGCVDLIDSEQGIITEKGIFYEEGLDSITDTRIIEFERYFRLTINQELIKLRKMLDLQLHEVLKEGKSYEHLLNFYQQRLEKMSITSKTYYNNFPFIYHGLKGLLNEITDKYSSVKEAPSPKKHMHLYLEDYAEHSYNWDLFDEAETKEQLGKLFQLLTEPPALIMGTLEDFINAFTKKKVNDGIFWLVKGKSGQISKSSLFYFINSLIAESNLEDPKETYNKKIEYVFRDSYGNHLNNIRQSKSSQSGTPALKERIDEIIAELKNS